MPGTSIGAQKARGVLDGRLSRSRWTFCLRVKVDAQVAERRLERRQHAVRRVELVEVGSAEETCDVPRAGVGEPDPEPGAEQPVAFALPELLGLVEDRAALHGEVVETEAEALVELVVVRRAELVDRVAVDLRCFEVDRVQVLVEQPDARLLERAALVAIRLVRHRHPKHPVRHRLAVHGRLERRLLAREACLVLARQVAEESFAREPPQLGRRAFHPRRRVEARQVLVALVHLLDVEALLLSGEVEVVLLVEIGDEAVGALAERVELAGRWHLGRHRTLGYGRPCGR